MSSALITPASQLSSVPVTSVQNQAREQATEGAVSERPASEQTSQQSSSSELSKDEQKRVRELKARDREVRAHEQAHLSAAGGLAKGGASYTYERGPDQQMYAVGGEVQVDTSIVANDPVATLRKAQTVRRAALAPVNPSSQDRQAAAKATQMASEAQAEIAAKSTEEGSGQESSEVKSELADKADAAAAGCPACGGAHSSSAHDGMSAYASTQAPSIQAQSSDSVRATA